MKKIKSLKTLVNLINNFNTLKLADDKAIFAIFINDNTWSKLTKNKTILLKHLMVHIDNVIPNGIINIGKIIVKDKPMAHLKYVHNVNGVLKQLNEHEVAYMHPETFENIRSKTDIFVMFPIECDIKIKHAKSLPKNLILILPNNIEEGMYIGDVYDRYTESIRRSNI
jgi:hypothetical protein